MKHALWFATRGTGVTALILLTTVVALGIAGSLRFRSERWPRFLVTGLHRNLTLLTLAFLTGHIATTLLDAYAPIGVQDAFVPFVGRYRPVWLGLGAIALDLLLALTVTSLWRARIGYRAWRALHWLAYASWPVALAHGLGTGSDARFGWMQLVAIGCLAIVLLALAFRLARAATEPARRVLAAAGAVVVAGGVVVWDRSGPAAHGWARRAGTPATLLGAPAAAAAVRNDAAPPPADLPAAPFTARFAGRLRTAIVSNGLVRIDIRGTTTGSPAAALWIRLQGSPTEDGGVAMTASGVRFGTPADPNRYVGSIGALAGTSMQIGLHDATGRHIDLHIALSIEQATSTVSGTVSAG